MTFVCQVIWTAQPGKEDVVRGALRELVLASASEPGNILFQPYVDPAEPGVFRIFELYRDQASFDAHGETDHFKRWVLDTAIPALQGRERRFFTTFDPEP